MSCETTSGEEAVAKFEQDRKNDSNFKMVLIDICMPHMDGHETTRLITQISKNSGDNR